jgi:DNA processing protein
VTNKNTWGPNTLIKQGAKLTAAWEDLWEDLPSQVRLQLEDELAEAEPSESKPEGAASLFNDSPLPEHQRIVFERLRPDESTQLDD